MSLKTRWLASMLGVVLAGTAITTFISSRISFHGAAISAYEWLASCHRSAMASVKQQIFQRLEVQARLLAHVPTLVDAIAARSVPDIQARMDALWQPEDDGFWAVLREDGTVLATSQRACGFESPRERPSPGAGPARSFLRCGRIPAFAVTQPLTADGPRGAGGWLVLGYPMNDAYADAYFAAAGTEVVLLDREGPLASSFRDTSGQRLTPDFGSLPREVLWADKPYFGKHELGVPHYRGYYATTEPLEVGSSSLLTYVLSVPLLPEEPAVRARAVLVIPAWTVDQGAFYSTVIMTSFSALLLLLLGLVVWRLVTGFVRPIALLGQTTARVAEGDLEGEIPVTGQDELGQLTRDFNDMVRKLRETQRRLVHTEKMAVVGQLAAGVGHEINNPLAYVTANLSYATETLSALSDKTPPLAPELAEVTQALEEAQEGAQRVARIVKDLRTFAHHEKNEETRALRVRDVVESALKLASNTLRHRARVTWDFQDTAMVEANEARLVQVFLNLLVNAAQAIPEGHAEEHEIRVTTALEAGDVVVEVSDTGTGMTPEVLEHLFEPFFTTKPQGQGTGLGLSISRNIVEGLGGGLTVRSTPGGGSTFRVALPSVRHEPVADGSSAAPGAGQEGGRILVVDDEPLVGASARRLLRSFCEVVVVTSSREALALVEAGQRFDLVLCDLMMPQMTGMELHAELSRRAPELAARMLFLTGGAFTPDAQRFLSEKRWLAKPFNESLRTNISEWLRQHARPAGFA